MGSFALLPLLGIVLLIALAAFFSGSETALTAVSRGLMHRLEHEGSGNARDVNRLIEDRERLIGALLLGNTFVNVLASSLATTMLQISFGPRAVAVATVLMTVVLLIFSEILPKTLAIARTDRFALAVARPVRMLVAVLGPVVRGLQIVVWRLLTLLGVSAQRPVPVLPAHEELRGAVYLHHKEGGVEREHRNMISGVLDLPDLTVSDVMIHRRNMALLNADSKLSDVVQDLIGANHTRIPLWRDQPENIVGVLHTKDLLRAILRRKERMEDVELASLSTPPWFVPETMSLEEQLAAFRRKRTHFALVVDEYGGLQGLVTLEDILDEIFGDIPDEHEARSAPGISVQADGSYIIDGIISVRDINRALDWNLPDEVATTLAGLVISEARTIPDVGQRFAFFGFEFEILRRHRNQVTTIRVRPPAGEHVSAPAKPQPA